MSLFAVCPAPFQKPKHKKAHRGKQSKQRRDAPQLPSVQLFDRLVSGNGVSTIAELDEPIVREHAPQQSAMVRSNSESPQSVRSPLSPPSPPTHPAHPHNHHQRHHHLHPHCENDSCSGSNESHSTQTSGYQSAYCGETGYQTDDGSFEGKLLHRASRDRPANLRMTAIRDYIPCCGEELAVRKGQRVKVLYKNNDWVYAVAKSGDAGYIPFNFVRPSRKGAGYQSEPEYAEHGVYQSGYDTDVTFVHSYGRRVHGYRTQIGDVVPAYSVHTGFQGSPPGSRAYYAQGASRGSSNSPPDIRRPHMSGYTSAVEYPTSPDAMLHRHRHHHPRSAKSLHNILDASSSKMFLDYRPVERKPDIDSFDKSFIEELVVIHDFEAQEEDEVFVGKGERVRVINADDPFWLWVETMPGDEGFVPRSCCSLGNHPLLQIQTKPIVTKQVTRHADRGRYGRRHYDRSRQQLAAGQARRQAKQRFQELARLRKDGQNPVCMTKDEIQRVGSKLIVLMDYTATQEDELCIEFAETIFADVLKQAGADRIWAYCPRTDKCGYVPISLVVPPVV